MFLAPLAANAQSNGSAASAATGASLGARIVEVRLAASEAAATHLYEPRLRRLVEIELGDSAVLAPGTSGPLGDHVAYVWVDEPVEGKAIIEVRIGERPVSRREISLNGLAPDVAARFVAVAASEMVRAQMQPVRPVARKTNPTPRKPTPEELELSERREPTVTFTAAAEVASLPSVGGVLAGPAIGVSYRYLGISETLSGAWFSGRTDAGETRWLELGLGADARFWLNPSWRISVGGVFAGAAMHLGDVLSVDDIRGQTDSFSARATGLVAVEARVGGPFWVGLGVEPGAVLRPVPYQTTAGTSRFVDGAFLGAKLTLTFDQHMHR